MVKADRLKLISSLEKARGSKVISYIGATRQGIGYEMSQLDIRIIYDHLCQIKKKEKIDLLINSFGGDVTFAWRLVHLIREFSSEFNVLIPLHAFSAATLIAFGADSIVMLPGSCLGPTDPQSRNVFNPSEGANKLPIQVEDIASYINFLKEDFGLKSESSFVESLKLLSQSDSRIHPLALGASKRGSQLARRYAQDLLGLHMKKNSDKEKITKIVEMFSSKLLAHDHPINRDEAGKYGLKIKKEKPEIEGLIWELFNKYEVELQLDEFFSPITEFKKVQPNIPLSLGNQLQPKVEEISVELAVIESVEYTDVNSQVLQVQGLKFLDGSGNINENYSWITKKQDWERQTT